MFLKQVILITACCIVTKVHATELAQALFQKHHHSVFQVRVIDTASGAKSSIGSAFAVHKGKWIISNYHVISNFIKHPDKYRLEYADEKDQTGVLELVDIDIINDLAVLKRVNTDQPIPAFHISGQPVAKGSDIYSLGNPLDLGMTIIEGIYNGQPEHALYQRILFSGSLNPGMSGGPALNSHGQVIGVNVSTAGNDISFLVPATYLLQLLQRAEPGTLDTPDFKQRIETQLFQHQQDYIKPLLAVPWKQEPLTEYLKTPERIADYIKCWGNSEKSSDAMYDNTSRSCSNQDTIYLGNEFRTGSISYHFNLLQDKDLGVLRFYTLYEQMYAYHVPGLNDADEDRVTDVSCHADFVTVGDQQWKVNFCSRRYKEYGSLYDISLAMALTGVADRGVIAHLKVSGCSKQTVLALSRKFMEAVQWQP